MWWDRFTNSFTSDRRYQPERFLDLLLKYTSRLVICKMTQDVRGNRIEKRIHFSWKDKNQAKGSNSYSLNLYCVSTWQNVYITTTSSSYLTISSMSQCSPEVSSCCAPWPELACSHQWFHGWLQLFLDYSCVVFGAKGKTRLTRLWICELSWKARGPVLMERGWTHTSMGHECAHTPTHTHTHPHTHTSRYQISKWTHGIF